MAWARTYDIDTPDGSVDSPAEADDRMREIKAATQERENVDHYWPLTGTEVSDTDGGEHRKITLRTLTAVVVAALTATKAYLYRLVTNGELYFKDASDNTIQLTSGGKIPSASLDMKDEDDMSSNSATHTLTQQSSKAYADAVAAAATAEIAVAVAAIQDPAYAGGESHTFDGGLIIKSGYKAGSGTETVTFGVAFPNAVVSATLTTKHTSNTNQSPAISSFTTTQLVIRSSGATGTYWMAIGY